MDTTYREIVDYWTRHQSECGLSVDWAEAETLCWRCAQKRQLQRCHIVPQTLGEDESPSNLVLLCAQCHAEAPNVADSNFMCIWLRAHAVPFYGTYWQERGFREYEFIFGEKPFSGLTHSDALLQEVRRILENIFPRASTHWGQGKINPATWAWVLRQVDQRARNGAEPAAPGEAPELAR
ncbi:MAG: HNH endonuclease [Thiobacillus sp.]|nr:HNH endonuclease [Thiobacillus sp.]